MWKPEYAKRRREKYANDKAERERRKQQSRSPEENAKYMAKYYIEHKQELAGKQKEYRLKNIEARKEARKAEYAADPEKFKKAAKEWQAANPEKRKRQRLKKYGITLEEYESLLAEQNGCCAICNYSEKSQPLFFPVVDHCHSKNHVRGLLCMNCNQGLGKFKDDVKLLQNAIKYLTKKRAN